MPFLNANTNRSPPNEQASGSNPTCEQALSELAAFKGKDSERYPEAIRSLCEDEGHLLTFYAFPQPMHHHIRRTNAIESFFRNVRRRSDQIDTFTTESSCLSIVWAVMQGMCAAERGLSIPDPIGRNLEGGSWIIKLT